HVPQMPPPLAMETMSGVRCERVIRPIPAVGMYVPAGTAPLPSAVVMIAVPVAAQLCGVDTVFKVGGAQAIAAMAYGTESIPKVDKICGPGSAWVTAA